MPPWQVLTLMASPASRPNCRSCCASWRHP